MDFKKIMIVCAMIITSCKKDLGNPPEIKLYSIISIQSGLLIEFEVVDEDFEMAKLYLSGNLYKTYSVQHVRDTIFGVIPFNFYNVKIVAKDEKGNERVKEYLITYGPPPLTYTTGYYYWLNETIRFIWSPVLNAESYELQISRSFDDWSSNIVVDTFVIDTVLVITLNNVGGYYWRVRASKGSLRSEWSVINSLHVEDLSPPNLIDPLNDTCWINEVVIFSWYEKAGANRYAFELATNPQFSNILIDTIVNDLSISWPSGGNLGWYYWRVRAGRDTFWTLWSDAGSFEIISVPAPPVLLSPSNNSSFWNSENIRFSWTHVNGAQGYEIEVFKESFGRVFSAYTSSEYYNWTPGYSFTGGYYARVRGKRENIYTLWSDSVNFSLVNSIPNILSPDNNSSFWNCDTLIFRWNVVELATSYRLQVSSYQDFRDYVVEQVISDTMLKWVPLSQNGKFYWRVRAEKDGFSGYFSDIRTLYLCPYAISAYSWPNVEFFEVKENSVFVVSNGGTSSIPKGRLSIINFSTPEAPFVFADFLETSIFPTKYTCLSVSGNYIFVVDSIWGLRVFEVSGSNLQKIASWDFYPSSTFYVFVKDNFLYTIDGGTTSRRLSKFDISNPANPRLLGGIDISYALSIFADNNYAYIAAGVNGVVIVDTRSMNIQSRVVTPSAALSSCKLGNYLIVALGSGGLCVIDVSNPSSPRVLSTYSRINAISVNVFANEAICTGLNNLITVLDLNNPLAPKEFGYFRPYGKNGRLIKVSENYVFVSTEGEIYVIKMKW